MQISFVAAPSARVIAQVVDQDRLPAGLEPPLADGARASRFTGKAGQVFEGFVSRDGTLVRVALVGAGEAAARDRIAALEKAGAALTAKYTPRASLRWQSTSPAAHFLPTKSPRYCSARGCAAGATTPIVRACPRTRRPRWRPSKS